ncbi:MAG: exonuclease subunit SbcD [Spirochaetaceae bacterium]|nr:exonuclease subunit SbcD [Spirochaetaceae bacterium]
MIHLLQTGDLHLGKIFYGFSLIEDQKFMLNQLIKTISEAKKQNPYQAVIITGDIYDRSVPPTDAIELFDEFLIELHQIDKDLKILLIPGNHDSAGRLSFGTRFLESQNIFICTNPENIENPVFIEGSEFSSNKNDGIYFYQIPFLSSGSLFSKDKNQRLTTQEELINEAISRIKIFHENSKYKNLPMGLNAHLFTLGGTSCDSERHFIGNAELINKNVFEDFSYVAL